MSRFTPREFVDKLTADDLSVDGSVVTVGGMVKADGSDQSNLLFSTDLSCETWTTIPLTMIESIEQLRMVNCKDHKHPLVKIAFKMPTPDQPELNALLTIIAGLQNQLSWFQRSARSGSPWSSSFASNCAIVSASEGLTICCTQTTTEGELEVVCTGIV